MLALSLFLLGVSVVGADSADMPDIEDWSIREAGRQLKDKKLRAAELGGQFFQAVPAVRRQKRTDAAVQRVLVTACDTSLDAGAESFGLPRVVEREYSGYACALGKCQLACMGIALPAEE